MPRAIRTLAWAAALAFAAALSAPAWSDEDGGAHATPRDRHVERDAARALGAGRHTFRFDTFGDEAFWGDTLKLHRAIEGSRFGGVARGSVRRPRWRSGSR
jgi:Ni/Co efflux regulator RcnB